MWNAYSSAAAVKWVLLLFMLGRAWLCSIMGCSAPGSPVLTVPQSLLTFMSSQWCYLTVSSSVAPFFSCPQSFPASRSFPISLLFASGGQSIETSASASVLPMTIQGWFPLGLTSYYVRNNQSCNEQCPAQTSEPRAQGLEYSVWKGEGWGKRSQ